MRWRQRPILHGLCAFGMTCRAVLEHAIDGKSDRIASYEARFSAPVFRGDTLESALFQDGDTLSFEAASQ
jgi:acyl dehydratase